jgi:hypothetical protein
VRELAAGQETVPVEEDEDEEDGQDHGPREEDAFSVEDSIWENQEAGEVFDWESGIENGEPDFGCGGFVNDEKVLPGEDDWSKDGEGWGSPPPLLAELGWGDWDEQPVGEIKFE